MRHSAMIEKPTRSAVGRVLRIAAASLGLMSLTNSAHAVDLANGDKVPREVVVNGSDGDSKVVKVPARQNVTDICTACVILSGDSSVEAVGRVTVKIEGGKVSINGKR